MIKFNDFLENKKNEAAVTECATLLAERDVDPHRYIYESLKEIDPALAEGFWDGVQNFARNVGTGVKQFFTNVGQGARTGYNQAADTVAGPVAKFDAAERALTDLVNLLNKDERFESFRSKSGAGSVGDYLAGVLKNLKDDKLAVPQLMQTQVTQNYGTRGEAEAQQSGQQPQQNKPAMDMSKLSASSTPAPQGQPAPSTRSWERRQAGRL